MILESKAFALENFGVQRFGKLESNASALENVGLQNIVFYPPIVKSRRADAMVILNPATTSSKDIKVIIKKVDVPVG